MLKFGNATKVSDQCNDAKDSHDVSLRRSAKQALKYPPVRFSAAQRETIAAGFGRACKEGSYRCLACCIGHDHAHLIIEANDRDTHAIIGHLKSHATRELTRLGIHPLAGHIGKRGGLPTPWSEGGWTVFIDHQKQLEVAIEYVDRHPEKENLPRQDWAFVIR